VSGKDLIIEPHEYRLDNILADVNEIRRFNKQRHEMEQLTAIVFEDVERLICVGYKQTSTDDFWVRGHMPEFPLLPGVMMCEAAAQLASYFSQKFDLLGAETVGLGGLEDVRIRGMVRPGDRLVVAVQQLKIRRGAMIICRFQGLVDDALVCEGTIKGVPLAAAPAPTASASGSAP